MIVYKTQLVNPALISNATEYREKYKNILKGFSCHLCTKDTIISWDKENNMAPIILACFEDFNKKVYSTLKLKKLI